MLSERGEGGATNGSGAREMRGGDGECWGDVRMCEDGQLQYLQRCDLQCCSRAGHLCSWKESPGGCHSVFTCSCWQCRLEGHQPNGKREVLQNVLTSTLFDHENGHRAHRAFALATKQTLSWSGLLQGAVASWLAMTGSSGSSTSSCVWQGASSQKRQKRFPMRGRSLRSGS